MRTCVIFNPAAKGEKAGRLRRCLEEIGAGSCLRPTGAAGQGRVLAAQAVGDGFDVIVAAGGDGTLNEVLNGIGDVADGFERARLGVLPLGTVNVFAKEIGLPMRVRRAWGVIQRGRERVMDLPQIEFATGGPFGEPSSISREPGGQRRLLSPIRTAGGSGGAGARRAGEAVLQSKTAMQGQAHNQPVHDPGRGLSPIRDLQLDPPPRGSEPATVRERRYFAQMAGAGLDARAIDLMNWEIKKVLGPVAYLLAAGRALREPRPRITVAIGSETAVGELVLVGNGRFYGGRFPVFPNGDLGDGLLELVVLPRATWLALLRCGLALATGRWDRLKDIRRFRAESFRLEADLRARLEVDGEAVGDLPATFSVRPKALRVIAP